MKVIVHIYNYMDDLRGGYISPVDQACNLKRYEPIFLYAFRNMASELAAGRGLEIIVPDDPRLRRFFDTLRLRTFSIPGIAGYFRHTALLTHEIRRSGARIIHAQNFESLILCYLAARLTRSRLVLHLRGDAAFERVRVLFRLPDHVIAVSESLQASLLSRFAGRRRRRLAGRISVIENGISVPSDYAKSPADTVNLVIVGAINQVKGQLEFVRDVWPLLRVEAPGRVRLYLVGGAHDPEYERSLRDQIAADGDTDIVFTGLQTNMSEWYRLANVVVIYSIYEGLPRVALEAMSYGTPVVATNIVGNSDVVVDGRNGRLVDRGKPQATAEVLRELIENPGLRDQLGVQAREDMLGDRFSIRRSAAEIEDLYDALLGNLTR